MNNQELPKERGWDGPLERATLRKVTWRLIPFLFLLYVVNILDRVNVSFARLQMLDDLGLDEKAYAFGAGIFYVGYFMFEVPSNLILRRTGARRWISRILISWGLITSAMMAVNGAWSFYLLRFLLGFAEAGFFPGIILYLTYWFPTAYRGRIVAYFMAGSPITGMIGLPISGAIMQYLDEFAGLRGWQWLFLLEGAPAVILGFAAIYLLTDRPEQAGWLTPDERDGLVRQIGKEEKHREQRHALSLLRAMVDGRVWLLILLYFTVAAGSNGFGFYLPKLLETRFPDRSEFELGLLAAIPNACAVAGMILNGIHSDRTRERRWHVAVPAFLAALGWSLTAWIDSPLPSLFALALVQVGTMSMLATFWSLPTSFLSGVAAAGGIALINSVGNLGGFAGPNIIGQLKAASGNFTSGLATMAVTLFIGGLLALSVRQHHLLMDRSPMSKE
jgi:ACS family tartrate transporter-like MFS transporter